MFDDCEPNEEIKTMNTNEPEDITSNETVEPENTQTSYSNDNVMYQWDSNMNSQQTSSHVHQASQPIQQTPTYPTVSVGEWVWTYILIMCPFINWIMLIIWAVDKNTNPSKRNFAKGVLIVKGILIGLYILGFIFATLFSIRIITMPHDIDPYHIAASTFI